MSDATDVMRPNARCPRCGAAIHCGAHESSCNCARIEVDAATLASLRATYVGCLCADCLCALRRTLSGGASAAMV